MSDRRQEGPNPMIEQGMKMSGSPLPQSSLAEVANELHGRRVQRNKKDLSWRAKASLDALGHRRGQSQFSSVEES